MENTTEYENVGREDEWNEVMALDDAKLAEQRADNAKYLEEMTGHLGEPLFGDDIFE